MLLDDVLGDGFALIGRPQALQPHRGAIDMLRAEGDVAVYEIGDARSPERLVDIEGRFADWFDENRVDFVLLRPDRYVFDGGRAKDLPAVVEEFRRKRASTRVKCAEAA
jgi:3-(3-hydroxy-phenyl)propionate hydroxylase